jgi:uroporphyrinogen decarboxylase
VANGKMTSRERVIAALNHQEPDRVPIDFGSNYNTCVNVIAYNRLKRHLGIGSPTYMRYCLAMLAAPDMDDDLQVIKMMGGDILPLPRLYIDGAPTRNWKEWGLKDGSVALVPSRFNPKENPDGSLDVVFGGVVQFRMPKDGYYFDRVFAPLSQVENIEQLRSHADIASKLRFAAILDEELEVITGWAERMHHETEYAILGDTYPFSIFQVGLEVFGYDKFFTMMAAQPELVHEWMNALVGQWEVFFDRYLDAVGPYIVAVLLGDDYGTQRAPMISPRMFRELFKPYLARICSFIHKKSPHVKVLMHSCGSVRVLIPDFIEAGVDALNPVQTTAEGMDPAALKRDFGKDIVFWGGGVRCQTTLDRGSVKDVRREVKELVEIWKPGGGYVFCSDHDIQENVAAEKIMAAFRACQEYGNY